MSRQSENVQKVIEAERKRNEIVAEAKKGRQAKLRQARADADKEVAVFKDELEQNFNQYKQQQLGGHDQEKMKMARDTETELRQLAAQAQERIDRVADTVVEILTSFK